jgi:PTS system galactitol-specific IIA component
VLCTNLAHDLLILTDKKEEENMDNSILHKNLIFLNYEATDQLNLLNKFSGILYANGYVKDSYAQAVIKREQEFPTGLNTPGIKIAMPHTYPAHVLKSTILVATLKNPVTFKEMGNSDNNVNAQLVFMLAITDPKGHLSILSKLMSIFSDKEKLSDIYYTDNKMDMIKKLNKILF